MIRFTGDFEFTIESENSIDYQVLEVNNGQYKDCQVEIYICNNECNYVSCPSRCDNKTILFTTEPVFSCREEAENWGEEFKELFNCLVVFDGKQEKIKLKFG